MDLMTGESKKYFTCVVSSCFLNLSIEQFIYIYFVALFQNLYHVVSLWVVDMLLIYSNCTLNFQFFLLQFGALGSSNLFRQGVFLVDFRE